MANANSQKIEEYYYELNEGLNQIEEGITECSHICKDYDYLEEQYEDLSVKYDELSLWCEENKKKEYKVGDVIEIPIILGENTEKAIIEQSYVTITGINEYDMAHYYEVDVTVKGELIVPKRTYVVWLTLRNQGNDSYYSERVRIEWPSNQTGKHILDGVCLKAEINKIYLENNTVPIEIFVQYY
jgi:hypothetical protein